MSNIRLPDPFVIHDAPGFTVGDLVDNYPLMQDPLQDGSVLQVKNGRQFWSINIAYPDLLSSEYSIIISAIEEAKRTGAYIDILLPQYLHYRVNGDPSLTAVASGQKGSTILVTGVGALTGEPLPGDLIKLTGNSNKVYRITSLDNSVNGSWTIGVYPDLVATTTGTEKPEFNNILFQTVLNDWKTTSSVSVDGLFTGVSFIFREAK